MGQYIDPCSYGMVQTCMVQVFSLQTLFLPLAPQDGNILCGFVVRVMLCLRTFESITAWISHNVGLEYSKFTWVACSDRLVNTPVHDGWCDIHVVEMT